MLASKNRSSFRGMDYHATTTHLEARNPASRSAHARTAEGAVTSGTMSSRGHPAGRPGLPTRNATSKRRGAAVHNVFSFPFRGAPQPHSAHYPHSASPAEKSARPAASLKRSRAAGKTSGSGPRPRRKSRLRLPRPCAQGPSVGLTLGRGRVPMSTPQATRGSWSCDLPYKLAAT